MILGIFNKFCNVRYWYPVQKEEATCTQSILLPLPLVSGCVDLHDHSLPRGLHPYVPVGQVGWCDPNKPYSSFLNLKKKSKILYQYIFYFSETLIKNVVGNNYLWNKLIIFIFQSSRLDRIEENGIKIYLQSVSKRN